MHMVLTDNGPVDDRWNIGFAMAELRKAGLVDRIGPSIEALRAALVPVPLDWLLHRLSALGLATGYRRTDSDLASAWMDETARLLADLPQDIVAFAIDQAVKQATRGFMPAVGAIRAIADPLHDRRRRDLARLEALARFRAARPAEVEQIDRDGVQAALRANGFADVADKLARQNGTAPPRRKPTPAEMDALAAEFRRQMAADDPAAAI
jgi:hypothetical protein